MLNVVLLVLSFSGSDFTNTDARVFSDSIRMETVNGKKFIVHLVDKGETLFSISRKYGAAVAAVLETNPGSDSGIEAGQMLKVPYSGKVSVSTPAGTVHTVGEKQTLYSIARQYGVSVEDIRRWNDLGEKSIQPGMKMLIKKADASTDLQEASAAPPKSGEIFHIVSEKETLFGISRLYRVSVNEIIQWNNLTSSSVKEGQKLLIKKIGSVEQAEPAAESGKPEVIVANPKPVSKPAPQKIEPVKTDEKNESGFALLSEKGGESRKYLAYHRTIPEGTVLRVRNKENKKEIFVRITGKLPESDGQDVLIRISRAAWDKLGGGEKFPAEIVFFD
jgi:LysM repeat protein